YEWSNYNKMKFTTPAYYGFTGPTYDTFYNTNKEINTYYKPTNTVRIGAEYRVTPRFSVRAGYSFVSSPVAQAAKDNSIIIETTGTMPEYRFDNTTNYVSAGLGYKISNFYVDLAYVYKHQNSTYHAYTSDPSNPSIVSPQASVNFNNSQIVLSAGFKY
ncbi:MAG: outer membrane protein transport protein, partial [Muribaculaceae bacterium]|nr:outer membrane protein transport protein [Muribaculaceae bacterium]